MVNKSEQDLAAVSGDAGGPEPPAVRVWRLDSPASAALAADAARFEDLQTVLQCCERLLGDLSAPGGGREPGMNGVVGSLWSTALAAYTRCFDADAAGAVLGEDDVAASHPDHPEARTWHQALLALAELDVSATEEDEQVVEVGVVRDDAGEAAGIAVTGGSPPRPDELTVRSAGTIAYALSGVLDTRLVEGQAALLVEVQSRPPRELDALDSWEVPAPGAG